ncbi:MAG: DNA starvation/stationary phase protection protein [Bacteroidetes bacterium RIFCSPHIGHO2_02_FULL_44_7]|nr:MAG: DNA starvation/stationary phase protection protein [Bacteroidetes bacterium RIFCSPHIGHO2_02_FULL_44_7]
MDNRTYTNDLNTLLSSYQVHYQNLRALHWNIKGSGFFELHLKYEELYTRALIIIDELAERILSIGASPNHRFDQYLENSSIAENPLISGGKAGMNYILSAQKILLAQERVLLVSSSSMNDEGTNALMSDLIREKEKTNWMFAAWLEH